MDLPAKFIPFAKGAPCAVMTRMIAEYLLDQEVLQALFQEHAATQYDRAITLDHLVAVMLDVNCGVQKSVRSSFLKKQEEIAASLTAFYAKLNRVEPKVGMALVAKGAERLRSVIANLAPPGEEPIRGFRSFILDGNMLAGTDHRLKPLRKTRAAALPGKSLALFECSTGLVTQAVLWEDAYSQERALLGDFAIPADAHLIADRNFCVRWFLEAIEAAGSFFTIRHHKQLRLSLQGKRHKIGRCETGMVYEQAFDRGEGQPGGWRVITVQLDEPTRDGETEIVLITNLPAKVKALKIAAAYRTRWTIENHFQRLTDYLNCEISTLGEPRAALFAFATSLLAGNMLAVLIAALASAQGRELADNLSYHYLVDEVAGNYRGMMVALPPSQWEFVRECKPKELANTLRHIARNADPVLLRKTKRGPKKPRRTPNCTNVRHLSTRRLLDSSKNAC